MSQGVLVSGSWRLRHYEPTGEVDLALTFAPLGGVDLCNRTLIADFALDGAPGRADDLPLAVLAGPNQNAPIAYLTHSLDMDKALMMRVEERPAALMPLWQRIAALAEAWHLRLSNNECFYAGSGSAQAAFDIRSAQGYGSLGAAIHAMLDDRRALPFVPQFRAPPRFWHADIDCFRAGAGGVVQALDHARRRASWDERVVTAQFGEVHASGFTRQRSAEIALDGDSLPQALSGFAEGPLVPLARWRRLAVEIPCESLRTGHVFMIAVEDNQLFPSGRARHLVLRITYEKTRGEADPASLPADIAALSATLRKALVRLGAELSAGDPMAALLQVHEAMA
jgi:hypothetical protein